MPALFIFKGLKDEYLMTTKLYIYRYITSIILGKRFQTTAFYEINTLNTWIVIKIKNHSICLNLLITKEVYSIIVFYNTFNNISILI